MKSDRMVPANDTTIDTMIDTICAFVGCCKCGVERIGCEVFCGEHIVPMLTLRLQVLEAKIAGNLVLELATRKLEVGYRKYLDEGHLRFMHALEAWMGGMAEPYPRKGSYLLGTSFKIHNVKERIKACKLKYPPELVYTPYYPWYDYKTVSQKATEEAEAEQLPEPERIKAWIGPSVVELKPQVREETPVVRDETPRIPEETPPVCEETPFVRE